MAIVKQASGHKRQWSDRLPHLVCCAALLTLISAALAGVLGQRLDTLSRQAVEQAAAARKDAGDSETLAAAKTQWEKKTVSLEKALLSAKLKIKAEQTTSASIRRRLVALQKEVETLKKGGAATVGSATAAPKKPVSAKTSPKPAPSQSGTSVTVSDKVIPSASKPAPAASASAVAPSQVASPAPAQKATGAQGTATGPAAKPVQPQPVKKVDELQPAEGDTASAAQPAEKHSPAPATLPPTADEVSQGEASPTETSSAPATNETPVTRASQAPPTPARSPLLEAPDAEQGAPE